MPSEGKRHPVSQVRKPRRRVAPRGHPGNKGKRQDGMPLPPPGFSPPGWGGCRHHTPQAPAPSQARPGSRWQPALGHSRASPCTRNCPSFQVRRCATRPESRAGGRCPPGLWTGARSGQPVGPSRHPRWGSRAWHRLGPLASIRRSCAGVCYATQCRRRPPAAEPAGRGLVSGDLGSGVGDDPHPSLETWLCLQPNHSKKGGDPVGSSRSAHHLGGPS